MTWTYSGNPKDSELDSLRFILGDTEAQDPMFTDEELLFLLDKHPGALAKAGLEACTRMIAKLARQVDYTIGPESVRASQKLDNFLRLKEELSADEIPLSGPVWTGPQRDTATQPIFSIGMHDNRTLGDWGRTDGRRN